MFLFKRSRIFYFNIMFLLFNFFVQGQSISDYGNPFVKNFLKQETNKDLKVFDISQNPQGELYFATAGSLLEFDGFDWSTHSYNDQSDLRSVLYVDKSLIYTSGVGGFGFWSKNIYGILEYTSLYFKYPSKKASLLPVFSNISLANNYVYFQSFQQIHIYNSIKKELSIISASKGFSAMYSSNNRIFVQDVSVGLFEIINFEKKILKGTENISYDIINVLEDNNNGLIIVTKNNGFWYLKNGLLQKKKWKVNNEIKQFSITDVNNYNAEKLIFGTLRNGLYVISKNGDILSHYNKNNGLGNNSIRKVFKDNNSNVWLGTESGISFLDLSSETTYFLDSKGSFGTVYTSFLDNSLLYLGTNQGLFVKDINDTNSIPKIINNSIEQIWEIQKIDDQILVGSDRGLSRLYNNKLEIIHLEGGGWTFKKHPTIENILYVGFYSGIAVFKKINNNWKFIKKYKNFGESSRFIEFDQYGHLWVTHPSKGYYRLSLSGNGLNLDAVEFYGTENPYVETYAYMSKIDGNLVFYNPKGFFFYDSLDNSFSKANYPTEIFKGLKNLNYIKQFDNIFWYSTFSSFGYVLRNGNDFHKTHEPFFNVWNNHLNDFNKVTQISENQYSIGVNEGLMYHNVDFNSSNIKINYPKIKSIEFISSFDTIVAPINFDNKIRIPFSHNFLKVNIVSSQLSPSKSRQFQYRFNDESKWSKIVNDSEIKFPGLVPGNYILELRSKNEVESYSETIKYSFSISPPWYISTFAKLVYIFVFVFFFLMYRKFLKTRNDKYVNKLKLIEKQKRERQKEKFDLEKLATDKELLIMKEKNLNLEIKKKDSALALSTLNNIKKNELLNDLIRDLSNVDIVLLNTSIQNSISRVLKKIIKHLKDKEDWLTFELHFRNSHSQFFDKLIKKHSNLSSNEIKLCAYLKLNLSSKEIASLMHVAITSVEQSRYRLRKKFNLSQKTNLSNYIQNF